MVLPCHRYHLLPSSQWGRTVARSPLDGIAHLTNGGETLIEEGYTYRPNEIFRAKSTAYPLENGAEYRVF